LEKDRSGSRRGSIGDTMVSQRNKQFVLATVALLALSPRASAQWSDGVAIASDEPSPFISAAAEEEVFLQAIRNQLAAYQEEIDSPDLHESMRADDRERDDEQQEDRRQSRFNDAAVRRGEQFFDVSCTQCHDAERATSKRKSYSGWLATVRRMAAKEDADIPANEQAPIATYLASLNPANQGSESGGVASGDTAAAAQLPPFTLNGTVSTVWRGTDNDLENKGIFS
jgi:DNA-binding transcriptional regulator YdaS (Cro superfamily)